jgi:hypothetical protein
MRPSRLLVFLLVSSVLFIVLPRANAQQKSSAPAQKYVACWAANLNAGFHTDNEGVGQIPQKKYYSGIFTATATAAQRATIQNAFSGYLLHTYPNDNTGPGRCGFYGSEGAAQGWLNTAHTDDNSNNRQIFDTGWTYEGKQPKPTCNFYLCQIAVREGHCDGMRSRVFQATSEFDSVEGEWRSWAKARSSCFPSQYNDAICHVFATGEEAEHFPLNQPLADWVPSAKLQANCKR